jgi:glutamine synthetase
MLFAAATRHLVRSSNNLTRATAVRGMASLEQFSDYGKAVFAGKIANEYLSKHGASGDILKDPTWVTTHADVVADAVFDW